MVANFGAEHVDNKTIDMDEPDVKRFKGALDQYFQRQLSSDFPSSSSAAVSPCSGSEVLSQAAEVPVPSLSQENGGGQKDDSKKSSRKNGGQTGGPQKPDLPTDVKHEENAKQESSADCVDSSNGHGPQDSNTGGRSDETALEEKPAPNPNIDARSKALAAGTRLGTFDLDSTKGYSLVHAKDGAILVVPPEAQGGNRKVPPNRVLWRSSDSKVIPSDQGVE